MTNDLIVEEVRTARAKILEDCRGDLKELMRRFREDQKKHPDRIITKEELNRRRARQGESAG